MKNSVCKILVSIFVFVFVFLGQRPAGVRLFAQEELLEGSTEINPSEDGMEESLDMQSQGFSQNGAESPRATNPDAPLFNLNECILLALENRRPEWQQQVGVQEGSALQAKPNWVPRVQVEEIVGPLPEYNDLSDWGFLNRVKVQAGVPIFTFGRITNFYDASLGRVKVEQSTVRQLESQEVLDIIKLYNGLLFAGETLNILRDAQGKIFEYRDTMEARYKKKPGDVSRADILQMRFEIIRLERQIADAEEQLANAKDALGIKIGFDRNRAFDIEDRFLRPVDSKLLELDSYRQKALVSRPEINMLAEGLLARKSLVSAEKKGVLPSFFLGGFYENSMSTTREFDQDFNYNSGGLGLALNWDFDLVKTQGKVKSAEAEYFKLVEQQRQALPAIELDVTRAYRQAKRMKENVERGRQASKISRALMFFAKSNWDIGLGDAARMKDALVRFNEARFEHIKSIFDYNVAMAELSRAVGEKLVLEQPDEHQG